MTAEASVDAVRAALDAYLDPYLQETLGSAQAVREVRAAGGGVAARIVLGVPIGGAPAQLPPPLSGALAPPGIMAPLALHLQAPNPPPTRHREPEPLREIRN